MIILENPLALILIPIFLVLFILTVKLKKDPAVKFSSKFAVDNIKPSFKIRAMSIIGTLRLIAFVLIIIAISRPQSVLKESEIIREGIDIVLAIDSSTSMLAEDFEINNKRVNRLEVVKQVVKKFIEGRPDDRIGIVTFSGRAYTVCPLTLDHEWLLKNLDRIRTSLTEDGTAIGSGIGSALNRLKDTETKNKVIILLTDGINNTGKISPITAAEAAKALDVKIYTIGAGTKGLVPYPVKGPFGDVVYRPVKIEIDEKTLKKIAQETGGRFYRATSSTSLANIYREIDKLEKTKIKEKGYMEYDELFSYFLFLALFLIITEVILKNTILGSIP